MKTRLLTGVPAALVLLGLVFWAPFGLLRFVVLLMGVLAYWEYDHLMFPKSSTYRKVFMSVLVGLCNYQLGSDPLQALYTFVLSFVAIFISSLFLHSRQGSFEEVVHELSLQLLGLIYVSGLFGFLYGIVVWPELGRYYLLLLFLLVFIGDTAAYFGGMKWGKRKLAEKISPNKTVEGAWTAILSSVVVSFLWIRFIYPEDFDYTFYLKVLVFAPFGSVLAQMGDLFESVLKRSQSQKDSGSFLPGHGGILDRVDGLALISPVFYLYLTYALEKY